MLTIAGDRDSPVHSGEKWLILRTRSGTHHFRKLAMLAEEVSELNMPLLQRKERPKASHEETLVGAKRSHLNSQQEKVAQIAERENELRRRKAELELVYQEFLISRGESRDSATESSFAHERELDKVNRELLAVSAALQHAQVFRQTLGDELAALEQQFALERQRKFLLEAETRAGAEVRAIADAFLALTVRLGRLTALPEEVERHCGENVANQFAYNLLEKLKALDLSTLRANHGWNFVHTRFSSLRGFSALFQPVVPPEGWKPADAKFNSRR
jgi:hypothetical protein